MVSAKSRFGILISLVAISGFSQGMLLPLIAVILEQKGISSSVNGLHATGLYLGVLVVSPFMEKPMQKLGFKPVIVVGGLLVIISLLLFPVWEALWFWFILRVTIGIGDNLLHFGTQTWITTTSEKGTRGRNISMYGASFAAGFTLGPLMTQLIAIHEALPFLISAFLGFLVWSGMFFVRNKWPEADPDISPQYIGNSSAHRFIQTVKIAWVALLPPFGYGFLEATLNGIFPIYGMRIGHDVHILSLILPLFASGSILSQIPLGMLSDRIGRRKTLLCVLSFGIICFVSAAMFETSVAALFLFFALSGMFVGSLYSQGISYLTDLLPASLLPAGNIMVAVSYSIGSISGPYLGGHFLKLMPDVSFFYLIVCMLFIMLIAVFLKRDRSVLN